MFYIGLHSLNMKNFFLSVTTGPSAFIFGMRRHLVHFYQACLNNAPVAKNGPLGVTCFM